MAGGGGQVGVQNHVEPLGAARAQVGSRGECAVPRAEESSGESGDEQQVGGGEGEQGLKGIVAGSGGVGRSVGGKALLWG